MTKISINQGISSFQTEALPLQHPGLPFASNYKTRE
jgi:hypothetical protein